MKREREFLRRFIDVSGALVAIVVTAPILTAAALLIKIEDGGSVFFPQRRVGRFGKFFVMYKLRTMRAAECVDALKPAGSSDVRVTRIGKYLRKLSIDELPQLANVLRGDMALVGPRPEMPFLVQRYEPWQQLRHLVTPGITGLWQVTSRRSIPLQRPEATALDLEYVRRSSLVFDLSLLYKTAFSLLSSRGVY